MQIRANYEKIINIEKRITCRVAERMKSTGGFRLPSFVKKGKFVLCATDNIDFLENTLDGQNTLHGTIIRAGTLLQWLKWLKPAWKVRDRGFEPHSGLQVENVSSPLTRKDSILWGNLHDREIAWSASDRRGSSFAPCVWRAVSSHSSHHPQEVLLPQFSLYVHKGGLKPHSLIYWYNNCYQSKRCHRRWHWFHPGKWTNPYTWIYQPYWC